MALPKWLTRNPWIVAAVSVLCFGALAYVIYTSLGRTKTPPHMNYYTTDFGQTWFVDSVDRLAPFTKDGKEAYRLHIFSINGKRVPGYVDRFTPGARAILEKAQKDPTAPQGNGLIWASGLEVRALNGTTWYPIKSQEGTTISAIPSKPGDDAFEIFP